VEGISEEEVLTIIQNIDVNKNDQINYTEFLAGCMSFKNYRQDEILRILFQEVDVDGSKTIQKDELKAWLARYDWNVTDEYLDEKFGL